MTSSDPLVCAILLTRDRLEMAARAVRCFREQAYRKKTLLLYNTGESDEIECGCNPDCYHVMSDPCGRSIGQLRNDAIGFKSEFHGPADIIVHFDDDDLSHPSRIAEQVALLQSSGADAVGYNQVLCWDTTGPGEAWIYSNRNPCYAMGATLAYWRRTWERHPFEDVSKGEDNRFLQAILDRGGKVVTASGLYEWPASDWPISKRPSVAREPRLIYSIHGGNTWQPDFAEAIAHGSDNWRRVAEWDEYCRARINV